MASSSTAKLGIPPSNSTVSVRILRTAVLDLPVERYMRPIVAGYERFTIPAFAFLVEHQGPTKTDRVLFDLGVRKHPETTLAPARRAPFEGPEPWRVDIEKDVATQLVDGGIELDSVDSIIWSHAHFDHTGDPATFPSSTELVVGPGTLSHVLPAYPTNPDALVLETDFSGRNVREVTFDDTTLSIGGFRAYDFFNDGSFYLLDVPGHFPGHMTGLARVTHTPPTFILMGADTCHHVGQLRPSVAHPAPAPLLAHVLALSISRLHAPLTIPVAPPTSYTDPVQARASLEKLTAFDGSPEVFVLLAHDSSVQSIIRLFPEDAGRWKELGWKERSAWAFLDEGNPAFRFK